jgi:hypothetical protein
VCIKKYSQNDAKNCLQIGCVCTSLLLISYNNSAILIIVRSVPFTQFSFCSQLSLFFVPYKDLNFVTFFHLGDVLLCVYSIEGKMK